VAKSISLDDLVALNDEIAGLVRAGIPLELGLAGWGRDLSGPLGRIVEQLTAATQGGQDLAAALAHADSNVPPVYRAVVTAGLKSGRLPAALESLARTTRSLQEARGAIGLAVLYPLALVLTSYFLVLLLATTILPRLMLLYDKHPPRFWTYMTSLAESAGAVVPSWQAEHWLAVAMIPPAALIILALAWWLRSRRAIMLDASSAARWLSWMPVASRVSLHARWAAIAELLALLVEHEVPLDEALVLAADCSGDRRLSRSAHQAAAALASGATPAEASQRLNGFAPMLTWLVSAGGHQQTFTQMARHTAATYRRRAAAETDWLRYYLPMWLILFVGGSVAALFCVLMFLPYSQLLQALSGTINQSMSVNP
jgi:general secretion pathway protein F